LHLQEGGTVLEDRTPDEMVKLEGNVYFYSLGMWWEVSGLTIDLENPHACEKFSPEGLCEIWQDFDDFRAICLYWPFDPYNQKHFSDCGFSFKKIREDEEES